MENKNEFFVPINEVAKELDVPAHTLRYWEKQFASAVRPVTGAGNRRYYRRETIEKLRSIKSLLYDKGMTIAGVKKILHNGTFGAETNVVKTPVNAGAKKVESTPIKSINSDDIDIAINLLKQAKMFLD
jgi:DNA-binding transcriptional MerR regulator